MKRSNKISAAAFATYGLAWVSGFFGASGLSKALVVVAALLFLTAIFGYLFFGLKFLLAVLKGDKVIDLDDAVKNKRRNGYRGTQGFTGNAEHVAAASHVDLDIDRGWNPTVNQ